MRQAQPAGTTIAKQEACQPRGVKAFQGLGGFAPRRPVVASAQPTPKIGEPRQHRKSSLEGRAADSDIPFVRKCARTAKPKALPRGTDPFAYLRSLKGESRRRALLRLGPEELETIDAHWRGWSHEGQRPPATCPDGTPWSTWVLMAGRGFAKTRAGAEWIVEAVAAAAKGSGAPQPLAIALVGATLDDARRVMVEGRSGLLEVAGKACHSAARGKPCQLTTLAAS